ncbi:MAG: lysozyme inhibitor LprI family protein [Pseudomonadota bacterium]
MRTMLLIASSSTLLVACEVAPELANQPDIVESKPDPVCADAVAMPEISECFSRILRTSSDRRNQYLRKAKELNADRADIVQAIDESEMAFETYRDAECRAVRDDWLDGGGTARPIFVLGCQINLTDQRTKTIWSNWLIPMADSTPPFLPEPKLSL